MKILKMFIIFILFININTFIVLAETQATYDNPAIPHINIPSELTAAGSGGGGATTFTDLTDTPSGYAGAALQCLRVNAGQTAIEFFSCLLSGLWESVGGETRLKTPQPINVMQQNVTNVSIISGLNVSYTEYDSDGNIWDYI